MNLLEEPLEYILPVLATSDLQRFGVVPTAIRMVVVESGCAVLVNDVPVFGISQPGISESRIQATVNAWNLLDATTRQVVYAKRWESKYSVMIASSLAMAGMISRQPVGHA